MPPKTILIVDDSEFVRNYHSYILQQAGWRVVSAVDGADALEKLFAQQFDVVLTDINMPGMDGYELIKRLRTDTSYSSVPVIIVSTESESRDKIRGFEAGANLYMVKPSSPESMVEGVRMLLGAAQRG